MKKQIKKVENSVLNVEYCVFRALLKENALIIGEALISLGTKKTADFNKKLEKKN